MGLVIVVFLLGACVCVLIYLRAGWVVLLDLRVCLVVNVL